MAVPTSTSVVLLDPVDVENGKLWTICDQLRRDRYTDLALACDGGRGHVRAHRAMVLPHAPGLGASCRALWEHPEGGGQFVTELLAAQPRGRVEALVEFFYTGEAVVRGEAEGVAFVAALEAAGFCNPEAGRRLVLEDMPPLLGFGGVVPRPEVVVGPNPAVGAPLVDVDDTGPVENPFKSPAALRSPQPLVGGIPNLATPPPSQPAAAGVQSGRKRDLLCKVCDKRFDTAGIFREHMSFRHHRDDLERMFVTRNSNGDPTCKLCGYTGSSLPRHVGTVHRKVDLFLDPDILGILSPPPAAAGGPGAAFTRQPRSRARPPRDDGGGKRAPSGSPVPGRVGTKRAKAIAGVHSATQAVLQEEKVSSSGSDDSNSSCSSDGGGGSASVVVAATSPDEPQQEAKSGSSSFSTATIEPSPQQQHYQARSLECFKCGKTLRSHGSLKSHVVTHFSSALAARNGVDGNVCPICGAQKQYRYMIIQHLAVDHQQLRQYIGDQRFREIYEEHSHVLKNGGGGLVGFAPLPADQLMVDVEEEEQFAAEHVVIDSAAAADPTPPPEQLALFQHVPLAAPPPSSSPPPPQQQQPAFHNLAGAPLVSVYGAVAIPVPVSSGGGAAGHHHHRCFHCGRVLTSSGSLKKHLVTHFSPAIAAAAGVAPGKVGAASACHCPREACPFVARYRSSVIHHLALHHGMLRDHIGKEKFAQLVGREAV